MYDHEDEKVVFEEEYKLNKTIPACGVSFILLLRLHKNLAVTYTSPWQAKPHLVNTHSSTLHLRRISSLDVINRSRES